MSGKGSKQRPTQISKDNFSSNWDVIFGKKKEVEKYNECPQPCNDCQKNNTECFNVEFDPKFALIG